MHILIAPDKFKDCLGAPEVAHAMASGALRACPSGTIDICPIADGGEGTVEAIVNARGGTLRSARVTGPLPEMKIEARYGVIDEGQTAVIEMAAASGLALLPVSQRDPAYTTTFGTGELMMHAANSGAKRIIIGVGGSATIDGGIGCAQACGLPVLLDRGEPVAPGEPLVGADLPRVILIKHGRGSPIERVRIDVACDVTNPLCGPDGAARIFGLQKGATPDQIEQFDANLLQLATRNGKLAAANSPGAGAAGGLAFGLAAFFGATIYRGARIVLETVDFQRRLRSSNLCITGEGRLDRTSLGGKAVGEIGRACREQAVPCLVIAGAIEAGIDYAAEGMVAVSLTSESVSREQSVRQAEELIAERVEQSLKTLTI